MHHTFLDRVRCAKPPRPGRFCTPYVTAAWPSLFFGVRPLCCSVKPFPWSHAQRKTLWRAVSIPHRMNHGLVEPSLGDGTACGTGRRPSRPERVCDRTPSYFWHVHVSFHLSPCSARVLPTLPCFDFPAVVQSRLVYYCL